MTKALKFLRATEWTMGNGQCHQCCGKKPRHGWWTETVGHRMDCPLAAAIKEMGGHVEMERKNHSKSVRGMHRLSRSIRESMKDSMDKVRSGLQK